MGVNYYIVYIFDRFKKPAVGGLFSYLKLINVSIYKFELARV